MERAIKSDDLLCKNSSVQIQVFAGSLKVDLVTKAMIHFVSWRRHFVLTRSQIGLYESLVAMSRRSSSIASDSFYNGAGPKLRRRGWTQWRLRSLSSQNDDAVSSPVWSSQAKTLLPDCGNLISARLTSAVEAVTADTTTTTTTTKLSLTRIHVYRNLAKQMVKRVATIPF